MTMTMLPQSDKPRWPALPRFTETECTVLGVIFAAMVGLSYYIASMPRPSILPMMPYGPGQIRIMTLGDSITKGADGDNKGAFTGGYRPALLASLRSSKPVYFVGPTYDPISQCYHAGHGSWTAAKLNQHVAEWLPSCRPSVVLLMAGTNDLYFGHGDVAASVAHVCNLVHTITIDDPGALVLVSAIPPVKPVNCQHKDPAVCPAFNARLASAIRAMPTPNVRYVTVGDIPLRGIGTDGLHPNRTGYALMGRRWAAALNPLLERASDVRS